MEYKLTTYRVFVVFVVLYMSVLSAGIDLQQRPGPNTYAFFGSVAHVGTPNHAALTQAARDAHMVMRGLVPSQNNWPGVMTALWTGDNRIYFGSSVKGGAQPPWIHADVIKALGECDPKGGAAHRCQAKCGEINVLSHWYEINRGMKLPQTGKLIVAFYYSKARPKVIPPCVPVNGDAPGTTFGCKRFLTQLGFSDNEMIESDPTLEGMELLQNVLGVAPAVCYI